MSRSLGTNSGSRDSLNWRTRCGCKPCVRQMRCTELTLIPAAFAIISAVQCVVSPGGSPRVRATVRSRTLAGSGGIREGRVLSCSRPSIPARMNRSCQRHTVTLLVPAWRMISLVPRPSTVSSTIRARQTCFCRLFRSATIASKRARSAALTSTVIPSRMPTPFRQLDHTRDQDSSVWFIPLARAGSASAAEKIEAALQDVGGGDAVNDLGATLARHIGGDHLAGHGSGRQPLVPQHHRQIAYGDDVAGKLPDRLSPWPVTAGQNQRQADNKPADAIGVDQCEQPRHVVVKAPPPDGFERGSDDAARVGEGEAYRLGADIEAHQPRANRHSLAQR